MTAMEKLIEGILQYARPEILKYYRVDSCIVSTRICLNILEHHGFKCFALPCQVNIVNAPYRDFLMKKGRWPKGEETKEIFEEKNGYAVGVGHGYTKQGPKDDIKESGSDKWPGHLVAIAVDEDNTHYLIDLSIDQASRPQYNMTLKPTALHIPPEMTQKEDVFVLDISQEDESIISVFYYSKPQKGGYESSKDWNDTQTSKPLSKAIMEMIHD